MRIALIDDDVLQRSLLCKAMARVGLRVCEQASDGDEALRMLQQSRADVIITDCDMPKMNGTEFLKIAKADEDLKKIPVIVLTTSEEERDRTDSFNLSVAGYMIKPVDYVQFVEVMKTINHYWTISQMPE